ncbi:MAG: tryptophanase [Candidatus Lokiarchaeota archaeon]|nr:tryptophanase [Candidatus Lokiarchaeota archaeon]
MKSQVDLGVPIPPHKALVTRVIKQVTKEQRERALQETEYNVFSFPSDLLFLDFLSDSGTTTMTDLQWSALFHGDESYGRNKGYYVLLDAIRDVFERGDSPKKSIELLLSGVDDVERLMNELYLVPYEEGFVNGGIHQLDRPNAFIVPQGRCAEFLLFSTISKILHKRDSNLEYYIPNNGHFDTTEANIVASGLHAVNLFDKNIILEEFPLESVEMSNPFKGNMDIRLLKEFIKEISLEQIPLIYLTITNNTAAGQPVSLKNIQTVSEISHENNIPLFFDACRFAENAYFIKLYESDYRSWSIKKIIQKMFSYADGFTISFKKDGLANMGGGLFFRDKGVFQTNFSENSDIGTQLKVTQILTFGNDSYGGLSGRDIMALAAGLYEGTKESYLANRLRQTRYFAKELAIREIPVILPPGGHAVYIDMNRFFEGIDMKIEDYGGLGFTIELIRHFGVRSCELGPFAFEWDQKTNEQREGILNVVRLALPRNAYETSHIDYAVAAIAELYKNREKIPKVEIARGRNLPLRHFQTGLKPK